MGADPWTSFYGYNNVKIRPELPRTTVVLRCLTSEVQTESKFFTISNLGNKDQFLRIDFYTVCNKMVRWERSVCVGDVSYGTLFYYVSKRKKLLLIKKMVFTALMVGSF